MGWAQRRRPNWPRRRRRLASNGTSFSELVQETRRETALKRIQSKTRPLGDLARDLGYTCPSTLTRAVRRWTGKPPSHLRAGRDK